MIIALAGHVDHGKTALIRALTGVETDRLPEEQRRGMTIDLGFAYLHPPGVGSIGFVDVPGHERFLPNMLAGVLGIESVLLVVAADDGPMPQTIEHLAVVQLTGAREVIGVITKIDMVAPAMAAQAEHQVRTVLTRHGFADAPILRTSAITGYGIDALRALLVARAAAARTEAAGRFRMAIDRRFLLQGIGLVVTGTVAAGNVSAGDTLLLSPSRLTARVRSIRVQDRPAEAARAGDRCAIALTGARIDADRVQRGQWVIDPALHAPTQTVDCVLRVAGGQTVRPGTRAHLHLGTGATGGRIRLLTAGDLGEGRDGFVRLTLDAPIVALHGDRAVLRDDGSGRILAGGRVIDPFPPTRRRKREDWHARLDALAVASPRESLAALLAAEGSVDLSRFALARNVSNDDTLTGGLAARVVGGAHPVAISETLEEGLRQGLHATLAQWHVDHPDYAGPGKAALLSRVTTRDQADIADAVLHDLVSEGAVLRLGTAYHLPEHRPRLTRGDEALWLRLERILDAAALRAPRVRELMDQLGLPLEQTEALLERLLRFGRLHKVAANRFFLPETIADFARIAGVLAAEADGFSAADFNKRTGIGRNLTIQVLEYLDRVGATQRQGELRFVVAD